MGRILGIDLGKKRVGIAVSDKLKIIAQPLMTLAYTTDQKLFQEILIIIKAQEVEKVVIGFPLHADGQESAGCAAARSFQERLEQAGIGCVLFDERYSSEQAEEVLHLHGKRRKENRAQIDKIAAALILESYLASLP